MSALSVHRYKILVTLALVIASVYLASRFPMSFPINCQPIQEWYLDKSMITGDTTAVFSTKAVANQANAIQNRRYLTGLVFCGRLGNQMFQLAGLIGIANITNRKAVFKRNEYDYFLKYFPQLAQYIGIIPNGTTFVPILKKHQGCCHFDSSLLQRMNSSIDYYINDFLPFRYYFDNISVHHMFQFHEEIAKNAMARMRKAITASKLSRNITKVIGIHNRRGDVARDTNTPYEVQNIEYCISICDNLE